MSFDASYHSADGILELGIDVPFDKAAWYRLYDECYREAKSLSVQDGKTPERLAYEAAVQRGKELESERKAAEIAYARQVAEYSRQLARGEPDREAVEAALARQDRAFADAAAIKDEIQRLANRAHDAEKKATQAKEILARSVAKSRMSKAIASVSKTLDGHIKELLTARLQMKRLGI